MPGVAANDCGASRLLAETPITGDSFEFNGMENRAEYNRTGNKALWDSLIRQLPGSWLQTRTVNMNYENLRSVVHRGDGSERPEWFAGFVNWAGTLPYAEALIFYRNGDESGASPSYSAGAACLSAARREHDE